MYVCSLLSCLASQRLTSNWSVSLRPIGSHETCRRTRPSRCTARRAMAVRLFATEPRICEAHLSAVVPVVTCSTQSSSSVSAATDALRHGLLPFTPTGQVRPRDALGQSRTDKRPPSGEPQMQMQNLSPPFDRIHRKVKEESDASFVLSLLYYLGAVHRKSTRVPLRTKGGSARETRFKLAFPPAFPPNFRASGLTELVWF